MYRLPPSITTNPFLATSPGTFTQVQTVAVGAPGAGFALRIAWVLLWPFFTNTGKGSAQWQDGAGSVILPCSWDLGMRQAGLVFPEPGILLNTNQPLILVHQSDTPTQHLSYSVGYFIDAV